MAAKKWLIVSYFTRIDGMACAQHLDDRIDCLQAKGITPVILSGICGGKWPDLHHFSVPSVAPSGIKFELRHLKKKVPFLKLIKPLLDLFLLPFFLLEKLLIDLDSQWSWFPMAALVGNQICKEDLPELVYSTGGAASAHLVAAIIARKHGIKWVAEFQDPIVFDNWLRSKRAYKIYGWLERLVCKRASAVIYLTAAALSNAKERTVLDDRGWYIYPGADPAHIPCVPYNKGDACCFAHIGSLGGSRNLLTFLEGLRLAIAEKEELVVSVRLCLYGTCDRASKDAIKSFPYPSMITNYGRVSRNESLVAMKTADVLLLIQNTEAISTETIPSKAYEYFHSKRPILGLVYDNKELDEMLLSLGHVSVKADDPEAVKDGILQAFQEWQLGPTKVISPSPYSVDFAVDRLIGIADGTGPGYTVS